MNIIIGADIVPTESNMKFFESGNTDELINDNLKEILGAADFRIFNLEVPLVDKNTPITKCGPNLAATTASAMGIKGLGVDFLTLSNNHIMDQGELGLESTMKILDRMGIAYAGAGKTPEKAAIPYIIQKSGKRVGIYCCAEHEFSIVTEDKPGANPFDPLESLDHISELKRNCDVVIVLYHGGKEHYRYPSPYLQKVCRKIIEKGADLVVCQHTHCVGCKEEYKKGTIVYGQGNFLFDDCDDEFWKTSILLNVIINDGIQIEYIPLEKNGYSVFAVDRKSTQIISEFESRSEKIKNPKFVENEYLKIVHGQYDRYLNMIQGRRFRSFFFRAINKLTNYKLKKYIFNFLYPSTELPQLINLLECEVHRESFLTALKDNIK